MSDLEGHKLHLHPDRVGSWFTGSDIAPIYVDIGPVSNCNHRCLFCAYDYMDHPSGLLSNDAMMKLVEDLAQMRVKSICYAGYGEPLLNKATVQSAIRAKELGIDVAMSTNGVLWNNVDTEALLASLTWVRFSVNGGTSESYANVHKTNEKAFDKVINALISCVKAKKEGNLGVTIGVQFVFLPENCGTVYNLAKMVKEIGVDYFVIKPFYQHLNNSYIVPPGFGLASHKDILQNVEGLSEGDFKATVRWNTEADNSPVREYSTCYGLPFISVISASGDVFPCLPHQDVKLHSFGNINEQSFRDIWKGERRKQVMDMLAAKDKNNCQPNCRHHEINKYLWAIKRPAEHVNFI